MAVFPACSNEPVFPVEPEIEFVSISPDTVRENRDEIIVKFSFRDGDGDLGDLDNEPAQRLRVRDNRPIPDSLATIFFRIPNLNSEARNPSIQGVFTVIIPPTVVRPGLREEETSFSITITDRAGHTSNEIRTGNILIVK